MVLAALPFLACDSPSLLSLEDSSAAVLTEVSNGLLGLVDLDIDLTP